MSELMLDVGQANELKMAFRRAGYEASEVKRLSEGDILARVREVLLGHAHIVPIELNAEAARGKLTVLPKLTHAERFAAGGYFWKESSITPERFPHNPATVGEWEFDLYHPNCSLSTKDVKDRAEVDGWLVATWEQILAYGEAFPEEQRKFPIAALGSVYIVDDGYGVLVLGCGSYRRRSVLLFFYMHAGLWNANYRFLRVRKIGTSVA